MENQQQTPELKMFAALTKTANKNEAWITRAIEAENKAAAAAWFGNNGFVIHGTVYARK